MTGCAHGLRFDQVRHDCGRPETGFEAKYGDRHQVIARWKCPTCGARWRLAAQFHWNDRFAWERVSEGSWRWRRAERRRLAAGLADD